jgi:tetratricopeptide (TPR) repeat protein
VTLNNLGLLDRDQNRVDEARQDYEESLKIRRELAQKNPETYLPYVARTLNNLGDLKRNQNRVDEARQDYEEALAVYQRLAQQDPEQFQPEVARLNSLLRTLTK